MGLFCWSNASRLSFSKDVSQSTSQTWGPDEKKSGYEDSLDEKDSGDYKDVSQDDLPVLCSLPRSGETAILVGREHEIQEMRTHLCGYETRRHLVLHGSEGVGKSHLANAYAVRFGHEYSAVLSLNAISEDSLKSSFMGIARQILHLWPSTTELADLDMKNIDGAVHGVIDWLSAGSNTHWLLIFDNYDCQKTPASSDLAAFELHHYIPKTHRGSIIVTTRSSEVQLGYRMHVRNLKSLHDSLKILSHASGRPNLINDSHAARLTKKLAGLPLALVTAGKYLGQSEITFSKYLRFFKRSSAAISRLKPAHTTHESRTLFPTWQITFEQIEKANPLSANLLRLWAYFDRRDLWFELLDHSVNEDVQYVRALTMDKLKFQASMQMLCDYGLVVENARNEYGTESAGYNLRTSVHFWISAALGRDKTLARIAVRCVTSHMPATTDPSWHLSGRRLLNHANRCSLYLEESGSDRQRMERDCGLLGCFFGYHRIETRAETMTKIALEEYERTLGRHHRHTIDSLALLGSHYCMCGNMEEAEKTLTRLLEARRSIPEPDREVTLREAFFVSYVHEMKREFGEAALALERALEVHEKAPEPDDLMKYEVLHVLGQEYFSQGRLAEAGALFRRVLEWCERGPGTESIWIIESLGKVASVHYSQRDLKKAEETYTRALRISERVVGGDHERSLDIVYKLGNVCSAQGRAAEAGALYQRALAGYEKICDPARVCTLQWLLNVGTTMCRLGRPAEAERALVRALGGYEEALGVGHETSLMVASKLRRVYIEQGKSAEAEELDRRAEMGQSLPEKPVPARDRGDTNASLERRTFKKWQFWPGRKG